MERELETQGGMQESSAFAGSHILSVLMMGCSFWLQLISFPSIDRVWADSGTHSHSFPWLPGFLSRYLSNPAVNVLFFTFTKGTFFLSLSPQIFSSTFVTFPLARKWSLSDKTLVKVCSVWGKKQNKTLFIGALIYFMGLVYKVIL